MPSVYSVGDVQIATAVTNAAQVPLVLADAPLAMTVELRLSQVGAAGTAVRAYLQTSLDQGQTWMDIACAAFIGAGGMVVFNLSALTSHTTPAPITSGSLADNTAIDGILGDRYQLVLTTTGTWGAGTVLSGRLVAR